ncbi:MAG: cysteine synthase A [Nitrospirae bacterium GWD2_57_9]|nr:MAG: cysteine synthase A [Nitrospirae bacterium GWD2_57_9]OGW46093.1 MAG: cysteine synthase A [Nitrospirae bacterium GWC2_57_9]
MSKIRTVLDLIGNTPIVKLHKLGAENAAEVWAKLEGANPGGSVKDRAALAMIEDAEKKGVLRKGMTIVEPTSGNTGIGLAMVAAVKGYRVLLTMPESMTVERRRLLEAYGAELVLTPANQGMKGATAKADEILASGREYFKPDQFGNPANPQVHRRTTAKEILAFTGAKKIDAFVAGIGTGGTITGVGEVLKRKFRNIRVVAVEPSASPLLSGGQPGPHAIQGIGPNFVPAILNTRIYDEIIQVTNNDAADMTARLAAEEGLLVGISSGAACWAALQVAARLGRGKRVVTVFPDVGDRYLTLGIFDRKTGA